MYEPLASDSAVEVDEDAEEDVNDKRYSLNWQHWLIRAYMCSSFNDKLRGYNCESYQIMATVWLRLFVGKIFSTENVPRKTFKVIVCSSQTCPVETCSSSVCPASNPSLFPLFIYLFCIFCYTRQILRLCRCNAFLWQLENMKTVLFRGSKHWL